VPRICGVDCGAIGLAGLVGGWMFGVEFFKTPLAGCAAMKAKTAVALMLGGYALFSSGIRSLLVRLFANFSSVCLLSIGGLRLAEYVSGADLRIDEFLPDSARSAEIVGTGVELVRRADAALEVLKQSSPSGQEYALVILDKKLTACDGLELAARIWKQS
jgi:hypothetical protein